MKNISKSLGIWFFLIVLVSLPLAAAAMVPLEGECGYSFWPTSKIYDASGGTGSVTVTPFSGSCAWTAVSNTPWVTITSGSNSTGYGPFSYSVAANTSPDPRTGTVTVGGRTFTVTQTGASSQYCLDNWYKRTTGGGAVFFGAAYGKNILAAAGQGTILTSQDGSAWKAATLPAQLYDNFTGIAFGNDTFVAVGFMYKTIITSPDGLIWTAVTSPTANGLNNVVFCDGKFIALGSSGTILTSTDGGAWTSSTFSANHLYGAASGNGKIVAVGNFFLGGGIILSSDGGTSWSETTPKDASGQVIINALRSVAFGNGTFVAVGQTETILTSPDGIIWTKRAIGIEERNLVGITFTKGVFIAVGDKGTVISSSDGINWSYRSTGVTDNLYGMTYGNKTFIAVGDSSIIQSDPLPYSISGSTLDFSSKAGIQNVAVTVKDASNNQVEAISTDASGHYVAAFLFPGDYTIEASKGGYVVDQPPTRPVTLDDTYRAVTATDIYMTSTTISSIPLNQGWNFISIPRKHPLSSLVETALGGILTQIRVIWSYDNQNKQWLKYKVQGSEVGGQNTLTSLESWRGYWIYMNEATTLDLAEWATLESTSVSLYEGWDLIGYNGTNGTEVNTAISSLSSKWAVIWNWDTGLWSIALPTNSNTASLPVPLLSSFSQGKAYWIKMNSATTWQQ